MSERTYEPGDWITFTAGKAETAFVGLVEWHKNPDRAHQLRVTYRDSRNRLTVEFIEIARVTGKTRNPNKLPYAEMNDEQQALVRDMAAMLSPTLRARQLEIEVS